MKPDVTDAILVLPPFSVRGADPEACLAVRPPDCIRVFVQHVKAQEGEQAAVERLRLLVITDSDDEMIDPNDAHHLLSPPLIGSAAPNAQGHAPVYTNTTLSIRSDPIE